MGVVLNGLSQFLHVQDKSQFAVCLVRGLGGNLNENARENFAKEVGTFISLFLSLILLSFLFFVSINYGSIHLMLIFYFILVSLHFHMFNTCNASKHHICSTSMAQWAMHEDIFSNIVIKVKYFIPDHVL